MRLCACPSAGGASRQASVCLLVAAGSALCSAAECRSPVAKAVCWRGDVGISRCLSAAGVCHTGTPCGCQEESLLHFRRYLLEETSLLFDGDLPP